MSAFMTPVKAEGVITALTPVRFPESPKAKPGDGQSIRLRLDVITKTLADNYAKWSLAQTRGKSLCTSIEAVKNRSLEQAAKQTTSLYPEELRPYCERLLAIVNICEDIAQSAKEALKQLKALGKLFAAAADDVVYRSWRLQHFERFLEKVVKRYSLEAATKRIIAENIAHCTERASLVAYSTLWEYPQHANDELRLLFKFFAEELKINAD